MQYTIRNVPKQLDLALRRRARLEGKTLNDVVLEAVAQGLHLQGEPNRRRSVRDLLGARGPDAELRALLEDQRQVDPELWR